MKRGPIDHGKLRCDSRRTEAVSPVEVTIPVELGAELSDAELLCRAVTYSHPCGFGVIEKWRAVGMLFGVGEAVAQRLCKRFGVDPAKLVAR